MAPSTISNVKAAAKGNNLDLLRRALDAWAAEENPEPPRDPRWPMAYFQNCLLAALDRGNVGIARELLKRGCVVDNWSPLSAMSSCTETSGWDTRALELLLEYDWDVNGRLNHAGYPLENAIFDENIQVVLWLLQNGADPNAALDEPFDSPLANAAGWSTMEVFQLILKNGAKHGKKAAFLTAAERGRCDILRFLLDEGIHVNCTVTYEENRWRWREEPEQNGTALHYAAMGNHPSAIRLLLENGADCNARTPAGMTPREVAEKRGNPSCVRLLS